MNVGKAIYYLLANNASVSAITTRIYPEVAPQDAAAPYIVYTVSNVTPDDTHDGPAEIDEVRMEIMCVDDSYDVAADLAMAARVALDRVYGTYNSVNIESIQFTDASIEVRDIPRQYGQDLTFIVRIKRDDVQIATGSPIEDLQLWRLADVDDDIVDALDRQALVYDEATSEWIADGVGQVVIPVRNPSRDDSIAIGTVLKATGAQGDRILVAPFEPDTDDMKYLIGIASEALGAGDDGHAQVYGELRKIDTDAYEVGDVLYAAAGGTLSTTENQYPICIVTRKQQNTGRLFLRLWTPGKGYHQRYRTEALAEMFVGVGAEVELYYTATADGDGYVTQDLTAAVGDGNVEERVLRYKSGAFGDTTVLDYTNAGLATDATYAEMLTAFNNLLATEGAPITIYATRTEVAARTGLLADYPGAAAAYSLRLLDSDYTGDAIRVRRASDNAEQDIGFDGSGDLDTTALATFCSGTDGFVKVWYDQAGSNDATQTTTTAQPKIYDSTNGVVTENGKPAIQTDGSDDTMALSSTINFTDLTWFTVTKKNDTDGRGSVIFFGGGTSAYGGDDVDNKGNPLLQAAGATIIRNDKGNTSASGGEINQHLSYYNRNGTNASGGLNGEINTEATVATNAFGLTEFFRYGNTYDYEGLVQELVLYDSSKKSDRSGIETNINDNYLIHSQSPTGLLADYPGAAAAYSLRQLISTAQLAIAVRRDSDDAVLGIGFVNGELDTTTLATFCSGANGFVAVWYDQSGNGNDATQTTTGNQPKIYDSSAGAIRNVDTNEVSTYWTGNERLINTTYQSAEVTDITVVTVAAINVTPFRDIIIDSLYANNDFDIGLNSNFQFLEKAGNGTVSVLSNTTYLQFGVRNRTNNTTDGWANGVLTCDTIAGTRGSVDGISVGQLGGFPNTASTSFNFNGYISEIILYVSDQSTNRTGIETNINDYYDIF